MCVCVCVCVSLSLVEEESEATVLVVTANDEWESGRDHRWWSGDLYTADHKGTQRGSLDALISF